MRTRALLGTGMTLAAVAAADYRRWSAAEGVRLERGSRVVSTSIGAVELVDEGDGPPVLVLHGSPGGYDFGRLLGRCVGLAEYRLIAPSRPGYLRTPASSGRTPRAQADLMAALLDLLGVERAVVVGVSGGGPCALAMAQHHPDRCSHLVMVEALSDSYSEGSMYASMGPLQRTDKWLTTVAMKRNAFAYALYQVARAESSGVLAELAHSIARYDRRRVGYELDMAQFAALGPMPADRVSMPTLVIHGADDTDAPVRQSEALARRVAHARLVLVPGVDHISLLASPRLPEDVTAFLDLPSG